MKVRYTGPLGEGVVVEPWGVVCRPGEVVDLPDDVAAELVARGELAQAQRKGGGEE